MSEIPVSIRLAFGSEKLRLVFTTTNIIVAHGAKRGAGAVIGSNFFGRMSSALEDLFKTHKDSSTKKTVASGNPQDILNADKDNFRIPYNEIVRVEVDPIDPTVTILTLLTQDEKMEFFTRMQYSRIVEILQERVASKMVVKT